MPASARGPPQFLDFMRSFGDPRGNFFARTKLRHPDGSRSPPQKKTPSGSPRDRAQLPEGFRYLEERDAALRLETGVPAIDRDTFGHYYELSGGPHALVIVKETKGKPVALAYLTIHPDHVMIELLARNRGAAKGAGAQLVTVVEKYVATALGVRELRLEAMNQELAQYYGRLGFKIFGETYNDPEWGTLIPMRKLLP